MRDLPRSSATLADHAAHFTVALDNPEGHAASGLTPAQFADLGAEVSALRDALGAQAEALRAYRAATVAVRAAHRGTEARYRALRQQANNHSAMTDGLRKRAGLPVRDREPSPGLLPEITDLAAHPRPDGAVRLKWTGPTGGALRYEVFTRVGTDGAWTLVGSASATKFVHEGAGAGVTRYYRVEACRGTRRGEPSNVAAVYG
jgi:hypothetical protein